MAKIDPSDHMLLGYVLAQLVIEKTVTESTLEAVHRISEDLIDEHDWLIVLAGADHPSDALHALALEELFIELGYLYQPEYKVQERYTC